MRLFFKKMIYRYPFLLSALMGIISFQSFAQKASGDTIYLEGFISTDKTLNSGKIYIINHNVKVSKSAVLTVQRNTRILFGFNTTLVVEGGLEMTGSPNGLIELSSLDPKNQGQGILVRGTQGKDIDITYSKFTKLTVPLKFAPEWYRSNVKVENNIFKELLTGESNIIISSPTGNLEQGSNKKINFSFSKNGFINNWGSIFIENFQDNVLDLTFSDNLITNNVVYAISQGVPSNTPVFGIYDGFDSKYEAKISGNSIFGNYQINASTDTIIREIAFGVQGDGTEFSIPNNYYRSKDLNYISSTFDHFYQNSNLPLLKPEPILNSPSNSVPPHIWKVAIDGQEIHDYGDMPEVSARDAKFEVYFNKPVEAFDETPLESVLYDTINNELLINPVNISGTDWSSNHEKYTFTVSNASFMANKMGYLVLHNFKDNEGIEVPDFTIGQKSAINSYKRLENADIQSGRVISSREELGGAILNKGDFLRNKESVAAFKALTDLGDITYLAPYKSLAKTFEVGAMIGTSNYTGSLTQKFFERDDYRFSFGVYGQYNAHKWFSIRAMFFYGRITGEDITDPSNFGNRARISNFRNDILEGNVTFHWHLLKYGESRGERFTPSLFVGIGIFSNNPMTKIYLRTDEAGDPVYLTWKDGKVNYNGEGEDVWIPLCPIGTEGQTTGLDHDPERDSNSPYKSLFDTGTPKKYKKVQVSFPMGFSFNYIIRNNWNIGAEVGFRLTTSRYLDDVGSNYFDRGSTYELVNGEYQLKFDDKTKLPVGAHQSIITANPTITGKVKGEGKVDIPTELTFVNSSGIENTYYTAALLANPSLVNTILSDEKNETYEQRIANLQLTNDAFRTHDATKTQKNPTNLDSYVFIGVRASYIFRRKKEAEPKPYYQEAEYVDSDKKEKKKDKEKNREANDSTVTSPQAAPVTETAGTEASKEEIEAQLSDLLVNVAFENNSDAIKIISNDYLDLVAQKLNEYPKYDIEIGGHTDNFGLDSYNKTLSQKRAEAVLNYLSAKGVKKSRMTAVGYGEEKPIASNMTPEGRAQNQRIEIKLKSR